MTLRALSLLLVALFHPSVSWGETNPLQKSDWRFSFLTMPDMSAGYKVGVNQWLVHSYVQRPKGSYWLKTKTVESVPIFTLTHTSGFSLRGGSPVNDSDHERIGAVFVEVTWAF